MMNSSKQNNPGLLETIRRLPLKDKISLLSGADFWHTRALEQADIPALTMSDGPHGLRRQGQSGDHLGLSASVSATCFPTACGLASSWDRDLLRRVGQALGSEARDQGVNILLGPGANIKRNPLCGRNFEYYSEDPLLSGEMAAAWISGVQSRGVGASMKHFACNSQETARMVSDSLVDERALREIYLTAFEIAVKKASPATIMCAYNQLNGTYCSDNRRLLWDILRGEWGFEGAVVSDWGAVHDRVAGVRAGMDLEMPGSRGRFDRELLEAVREGQLPEELIDQMALRIAELAMRWHQQAPAQRDDALYAAHHALARETAARCGILLKNEGGILPLATDQTFVVLGELARTPRYQGNGSSLVTPTQVTSLLDGLAEHGISPKFAPGYRLDGRTDQNLIDQALSLAQTDGALLVCLGLTDLDESEGYDRSHLSLPENQLALLEALYHERRDIIVVLYGGSPVEMPWLGQAAALLNMYLPGQAGGQAAADLLLGYANPSGKLAETYPLAYKDVASSAVYAVRPWQAPYVESIYVGYRHYDTAGQKVLFPFGYGLSYTSFDYEELRVTPQGKYSYEVRFTLRNTGSRAGAEVAQVYVAPQTKGAFRPAHELKGFEKVDLQPGEAREVRIALDRRSFALYDAQAADWVVEEGTYLIEVGAHSRDIRLSQALDLPGRPPRRDSETNWYHRPSGLPSSRDFEALYGPYAWIAPAAKGEYTMDNSLKELAATSLLCRLLLRVMERLIAKGTGGKVDYGNPQFKMMMDTAAGNPMRSLPLFSPELMPLWRARLIVDAANGHLLRGLCRFLRRR
ncbi:MAG: glycoside hydrolase family 3 C-terminal domain-containing protein [Christensenellales bacterium]